VPARWAIWTVAHFDKNFLHSRLATRSKGRYIGGVEQTQMYLTTLDPELRELINEEDGRIMDRPDKLETLTQKMREARDLKFEIKELEDRLALFRKKYFYIIQTELVDLMNEVSQNFLCLPKEGNYQQFEFRLKPYYKANINNDDIENSTLAYSFLEEEKEDAIIKRTVTAVLGKDSKEKQEQIEDLLIDMNIDYDLHFGVPWNTLTSWLKERHKQYLDDLSNPSLKDSERTKMPPLEWFGATIGQYVDVKEQK